MRDLSVLVKALDITERNLCEYFTIELLSKECFVSVSCLQKLFGYVFNYSVGEYIKKRRLTAASFELINTNKSITEISLKFRYNSPEVFSRAFVRFWGILPSAFRKDHHFSELFPKFEVKNENGGSVMSNHRSVDVSKLYDELKKLSNTYILCADICHLKQTNETYGYAAGDVVIAKAAMRIDSYITNNMMLFRVGRDEFVIITGYTSAADAQKLAQAIITENGGYVTHNGNEIPLSMRIGISKIPADGLDYIEVLADIHNTIDEVRKDNSFIGSISK